MITVFDIQLNHAHLRGDEDADADMLGVLSECLARLDATDPEATDPVMDALLDIRDSESEGSTETSP